MRQGEREGDVKSWQECPNCGAVTFVWRDPDVRLVPYQPITAAMVDHPDGRHPLVGEEIRCPRCGINGYRDGQGRHYTLFAPELRRRGDAVP